MTETGQESNPPVVIVRLFQQGFRGTYAEREPSDTWLKTKFGDTTLIVTEKISFTDDKDHANQLGWYLFRCLNKYQTNNSNVMIYIEWIGDEHLGIYLIGWVSYRSRFTANNRLIFAKPKLNEKDEVTYFCKQEDYPAGTFTFDRYVLIRGSEYQTEEI